MILHRTILLAPLLVACGAGPAPKSVTVAPVASATATTRALDAPTSLTLALAYEQKLYGDPSHVRGIALDGRRLLVNVDGALQMFDARGPIVVSAIGAWKPGDPLFVVGDDVFDVAAFHAHAPKTPKNLTCDGRAFSSDGGLMSAYCREPKGDDAVYVYNTLNGAELGRFDEFHSAAPIRAGAITTSGKFIFWWARASGGFQEISSRVIGPLMSSHSVMSPDESMLFTTPDRAWMTEDKSRAQVIDPKNGREQFTLDRDVDTVVFSSTSRLIAAHHSRNWGDLEHAKLDDATWFTIHARSSDVLARVPGDDAIELAFARDDQTLAVRFASGVVRVFEARRGR